MNDSSAPNTPKRDFDWGPPTNSFFDTLKEWLVYLLLLALFGLGVWFFKDVGTRKPTAVRVGKSSSSPLVQTSAQTLPKPVPSDTYAANTPSITYQVQLGAFADRKSAEEAFEALKAHGFNPSLSEPDSEFEIYRVGIGPFTSEVEAEKIVEKLNSLEFHSFVVESF